MTPERTERDAEIRRRVEAGECKHAIAREFDLTWNRVHQISTGYKTGAGPKVSVSMHPGLHRRLRMIAVERGTTMQAVLRQALDLIDPPARVERRGVTLAGLRIERNSDASREIGAV